MPAPIALAHKLVSRQAQLRRNGVAPFLRPDAKSQVSVRYEDGEPSSVETVVLSTQHDRSVSVDSIKEQLIGELIRPEIPDELMRIDTKYLINPTGKFVIGGPLGDTGLTGTARSLSTAMAALVLMEVEPSQERIRPRSIEVPHTWRDSLPRIWWLLGSQDAAHCSLLTRSGSLSLCLYTFNFTEREISRKRRSNAGLEKPMI